MFKIFFFSTKVLLCGGTASLCGINLRRQCTLVVERRQRPTTRTVCHPCMHACHAAGELTHMIPACRPRPGLPRAVLRTGTCMRCAQSHNYHRPSFISIAATIIFGSGLPFSVLTYKHIL